MDLRLPMPDEKEEPHPSGDTIFVAAGLGKAEGSIQWSEVEYVWATYDGSFGFA